MGTLHFTLAPLAPFRLDLTVWVLRRRPHNIVDRWDGETYRRALVLDDARVFELAVNQIAPPETPNLHVEVTGPIPDAATRERIRDVLERLLGLRVDLRPFYALAAKDRHLADLVSRFRGVKPPRYPSVFEGLVNGIACQQISLTVGITLLNRLTDHFGLPSHGVHAFPRPEDLADKQVDQLRSLGFSGHKAIALLELALRATTRGSDIESVEGYDDNVAMETLLRLRGVGRWTGEYLLLRGLGRLHVFPGDDVGARLRLAQWLDRKDALDYDGVRRTVRRWNPYAGMIYFHLLLKGLADQQLLV